MYVPQSILKQYNLKVEKTDIYNLKMKNFHYQQSQGLENKYRPQIKYRLEIYVFYILQGSSIDLKNNLLTSLIRSMQESHMRMLNIQILE